MTLPVADFIGVLATALVVCPVLSLIHALQIAYASANMYVIAQLEPEGITQRLEICWTLFHAALSIWSVLSLGELL